MPNIFKNNKTYFILIIILIFILTFNLMGCSKVVSSNLENDILLNTDKFITHLFKNELEKAGELSLGIVRFNVLSNKTDLEGSFSIENIKSKLSFVSDDLAIVNSIVSYIDNINNEYNMVFYEIKLLKEEDVWKAYHLNEIEPSFNNKNNKKVTDTTESIKEDFKEIFIGYTESLSKGNYRESSQYLIGRAKKMHKKADPALNELDLVNTITGLKTEIICAEKNNVVVRFDYKNNDRPVSVLVYFYLTSQGWRIYNVNQI